MREILYQYLFLYQLDPRLESTDNREETLNKGKYTKLYYIQLNLTTCLSKTWFNSFWGKTLSKGELDFTGFIQKLQPFWRTFQGPYSIFKDHLPGMQFHILFYCTLMHFPTSF